MTDSLKIRLEAQGRLIDRLTAIREKTQPDSPAVRLALTRAAILISNQAKINARRKGIVDTGRLLNSIRYEFARGEEGSKGIRVLIGSFGIPYAAMHEFGGKYTGRQMRAMFASFNGVKKKGKGLLRNGFLTRRPYLRPAFMVHQERVAELLREAIEGG
jgi:phage gpG-like protein